MSFSLVAKTIFYSLAALVRKILFCHSKINFISSRHCVISSIYILVRPSVTQCAFFYNRVTPLIFSSHYCRHFVKEVKLPCSTFLDLKLKGVVDGKIESRGVIVLVTWYKFTFAVCRLAFAVNAMLSKDLQH